MVKIGDKYISSITGIIYEILSIEPEKILEMVSEENRIKITYIGNKNR